jgi:hypothetical protein
MVGWLKLKICRLYRLLSGHLCLTPQTQVPCLSLRHSKIFKSLADYLGDRTAAQCRSHFQKLLVKYRTAAKIKKHFRDGFGEGAFDLAYERFKAEWEQNHMPIRKGPLGVREFKEVAVQTEEVVFKEESPFQGGNEAFVMYPFAWGMPKMEDFHHPYYYLRH